MNSKQKSDTYTMPLKQLLKLLETTADDSPRRRRHARLRPDTATAPTVEAPEAEYFRF